LGCESVTVAQNAGGQKITHMEITEPSLHFYERRNRVRCFVCDMRGGHSSIDLVMGR